MSNQLVIRGCLERARFTLDLDLCMVLPRFKVYRAGTSARPGMHPRTTHLFNDTS